MVLGNSWQRVLILLVLWWFLLPTEHGAAGANYYLDASSGNDANSGRLPEQAWRSLNALNRFKWNTGFAPGDNIRFKRGEVFAGSLIIDEQSGSQDNPIRYGAYGSGSRPVISEGVQIDSQSWITVEDLDILAGAAGDGVAVRGDLNRVSSHIVIRNNRIHGVGMAGVSILGGGIHDVLVAENEIFDGYIGIYMASDTGGDDPNLDKDNDQPMGCNNRIEDNVVHGNSLTGIALDALSLKEYGELYICDGSSLARQRNVIRNNVIHDNGGHGIEITSNHVLVEWNIFSRNGLSTSLGGFSGIHLFDRWPSESGADSNRYERGGDYNIIRANISRFNRDRIDQTDGNGIQMDMWCDGNQVYNNILYGNDGAGIIVFGASRNQVYNNTLYDNGRHIGIRYGANELVVMSAEIDFVDEADVTTGSGTHLLVAKDNRVKNNIALAVASDSPEHPYYEGYIDCRTGDCRYALAVGDYCLNDVGSLGNNIFAHNLWYNAQHVDQAIAVIAVSANDHFQVPPGSTDINSWNSRTGVTADMVTRPLFVDADNANFHLQNGNPVSPAVDAGESLVAFADDFDRQDRPLGTGWDMGAYETTGDGCGLPFALASGHWQLISLPCQPPEGSRTPTRCFADDIGGVYWEDWVMYRYDTTQNMYVGVGADDALQPGIGYWILQVTGSEAMLRLPAASSPVAVLNNTGCVSQAGCHAIALATGPQALQWNMIGYPCSFSRYLAVARIRTASGTCSGGCDLQTAAENMLFHDQLWWFDGGRYRTLDGDDFLLPWRGYWGVTRENAHGLFPELLLPWP